MSDKTGVCDRAADERTTLPATAIGGDPVPDRVLIAPWGRVKSTRGEFVVDEESAREAREAFHAHGTDLPIDYEHQTLGGAYSSPSGQAPAAGWIKDIASEPGVGLFALVHWTDDARRHLGGGQYRYLSPVAIVRKTDRKLVAIHSVALTNKPAIVGMQPIVNRAEGGHGSDHEAALLALRARLDLDVAVPAPQIIAAACDRIAQLEEAARQRDAAARVDVAFQAGKITDAQRSWATELALRDARLFDQWLATAPVVVMPGRTEPPGPSSAGRGDAAAARAEYRAHPELADLTSEEAYVADAVRNGHGGE